jgi:hypothetical protein
MCRSRTLSTARWFGTQVPPERTNGGIQQHPLGCWKSSRLLAHRQTTPSRVQPQTLRSPALVHLCHVACADEAKVQGLIVLVLLQVLLPKQAEREIRHLDGLDVQAVNSGDPAGTSCGRAGRRPTRTPVSRAERCGDAIQASGELGSCETRFLPPAQGTVPCTRPCLGA